MGASTYAGNHASVTYYGRTTTEATYVRFTGAGTECWFRMYGNALRIQHKASGTGGMRVSIDGSAWTTVTTSATDAYTADLIAALGKTPGGGADAWFDVKLKVHPSYTGNLRILLTDGIEVTATGTPSLASHSDAGAYAILGSTYTGEHNYAVDDVDSALTSPYAKAMRTVTGPTGLATNSGNPAVLRFRGRGSKIFVYARLGGYYASWSVDGVRQGTVAVPVDAISNTTWGFSEIASGLDETADHTYEVTLSTASGGTPPQCDAVMLSGSSGAFGDAVSGRTAVLWLGDSVINAYDYYADSSQGFAYLASLLTGTQCLARGIGGNTVEQITARLATDVTPFDPDIVIVHTGYNLTAGENADITVHRTNVGALLTGLLTAAPNARILVMPPLKSVADPLGGNIAQQQLLAVTDAGSTRITYVNSRNWPSRDAPIGTVNNVHLDPVGNAEVLGLGVGVIDLTGQPSEGDTVTIGGTTFTFGSGVTIGASVAATTANLMTAVQASGIRVLSRIRCDEVGTTAAPSTMDGLVVVGVGTLQKVGANISVYEPNTAGFATELMARVGVTVALMGAGVGIKRFSLGL